MFAYTLKELAGIMNANLMGDSRQKIDNIWIDSRRVVRAQNGIFFALKGSQLDGHNFIQSAYQKGIRSFVVKEIPENLDDANFLIVSDPLHALQAWAKHHRNQFNYQVVGISGSNGKTIVKEWLYQLLYQKINLIRSPKSYNSQIGVPISVLEMMQGIDLAIFELGISKPNEMQLISDIAQPNIAVITNIGEAHSEFFENREQHILEKIKIADKAHKIIFSSDDQELNQIIQEKYPDKTHIKFGTDKQADIQLISSDKILLIRFENQIHEIPFKFKDSASINNALICFAVLSQLKVDLNTILLDFQKLTPVEMRLEILEGSHDIEIINDSFNSDLSSIPIALNVLNHQKKPNKTLIITDILQNRQKGSELYQEVANWVNAYPIQKVILMGNEITNYQDLFHQYHSSFSNTDEFLAYFKASDFRGEVVLLKGARKFELDRISKRFEKKSHDTILEVNLQNLLENVNYFRSKLAPKTKLMAMVKAFGYGAGGFEIAQVLSHQNIDYLGVAYADEGAELRQNGIQIPILVMNPEQSSYFSIIDSQLEPEIYSLRVLNKFTEHLLARKIQKTYPIHIKLNTGMNRLGFKPDEISELIKQLADNPYVKVQSVFSHLATSDDANKVGFVHEQIEKFNTMYDKLCLNLGYFPIRHILNSAGILNFPSYQMDMVRLGIGMFGMAEEKHKKHLKNVITFKTVISQITELNIGESVSYGRDFIAKKPTKIATLPVGYADGVRRISGNGNSFVNIHGRLAPIVGNICMDMMMVEITGIPCSEGDEVIIFGEKPKIEDVARNSQTISYEIFTGISNRVKRVYLKE